MIRIPAKRGAGTRCEVRNVDPAANPYLMALAILEAGLDGIESDQEPIDPVYDNIFALSREEREKLGVNNLPENLKDALKEFRKSEFMRKILGDHLFEKYIHAKEIEWEQYRILIHSWEWEKYL